MTPYDHTKIEPKWQKEWEKKKAFAAIDSSKKPKWYSLIEFPYPSGDGLHVGHIRSNTAMDIISRKRRREGYNVLYPIGWDAFGLPTENYAIKTGIQPAAVTKKNTGVFRRQLKSLGFSFDWSREINTTDPKYYKWTQWIFLQFLKNGLAYKKKMAINWCPRDLIGLANEEVVDGKCERCGTPVEKREKEQWMLAITKYADKLLDGLDATENGKPLLDWPDFIKNSQRNWIGKSEGAEISFPIKISGTKPHFLLLHGFTGSAKTNFFPWLKSELEKGGYEVEAPELPHTDAPTEEEQVSFILSNCKLDENTVIIGHSLGGVVAMKALMKSRQAIKQLVLVAPAADPASRSDGYKASYHNTFDWNYDFPLIKSLVSKIMVLSDVQEDFRIKYLEFLSEKLSAKLITTTAKEEHFCALQEPDVLSVALPSIKVFTTRPDTLFGVTYVVVAPEHALVRELLPSIKNKSEILVYLNRVKKESEMDRTDSSREKTGVELKGIKAINPVNGEEVPVYVADYVLADYGKGAVMAVPAHDDRDSDFAKKYGLPIKQVIAPYFENTTDLIPKKDKEMIVRTNIHAIIRNPKNGKYLLQRWKEFGWQSFVTGGVEDGENLVEAAKREVLEEVGYKNLEHVKKTTDGWEVHSYFYAPHKDVNRYMIAKAVFFDLSDEEVSEVNSEEKNKYDLVWLDENEVREFLTYSNQKVAWDFCSGEKAFIDDGKLVNSAQFNGKKNTEVMKDITAFAGGQWISKYKLRDWVFSRQRYWGEPIPVVHCERCGIVPIPEKDLPVKLPPVKNYKPTETGESPLAAISKWVNTKCPKCKGKAKRETDTMPNWAGSSWYYLRYTDPKNATKFADMKRLKYWTPVDWYNGGMEHVTLHLLYSRFWHKFLFDKGLVPTSEPYTKRSAHGFVLGPGGEKMSKSRGNVINPDTIVKNVGADSLRLYEMFMGPFDQAIAWDENGIVGCRRFLERVWKLQEKVAGREKEHLRQGTPSSAAADASRSRASRAPRGPSENVPIPDLTSSQKILSLIHKTIKKVSEDIESMRFNTAVSALMILLNELEIGEAVTREHYETYLQLLAPFAPHITEELWSALGNKKSIHAEPWPKFDPAFLVESKTRMAVQINGKTRSEIEVDSDVSDEEIKEIALNLEQVKKWLNGKVPSRIIVVKRRLVNIVVSG